MPNNYTFDDNIHIAIVVGLFNPEVTQKLLEGALSRLEQSNIVQKNIYIAKVPGAVEIPLVTKLLALKNKYKAIICLGAVIRGDTDHYDYVCQQVSHGCQKVMLEFNIPVIFGILTTNDLKQALDRVSESKEHKGIEAADAALNMIKLIKELGPVENSLRSF